MRCVHATIGWARDAAGWHEGADAARTAEASERTERHRLSGPPTMRRIERLETEARDMARKLTRAAPDTDWHARLTDRADELAEDHAYWTNHLADLEAAGWKRWTAADFAPGDLVAYWGGLRRVVRVNRKSLSVDTGYSWTDTVPYDQIKGKVPTKEPDAAADEPEPPAPAAVVTRSGLQTLLPGQEPPPIVTGDASQHAMF